MNFKFVCFSENIKNKIYCRINGGYTHLRSIYVLYIIHIYSFILIQIFQFILLKKKNAQIKTKQNSSFFFINI